MLLFSHQLKKMVPKMWNKKLIWNFECLKKMWNKGTNEPDWNFFKRLLLLLFHWNVELFELGAAGAVEKPEYYNIFQARDGEKALHLVILIG